MSKDKKVRTRTAGIPVAPVPEPRLKLLRPNSGCSTADHALGLSEEVKEMLKGLRRKPASADDDGPDAA